MFHIMKENVQNRVYTHLYMQRQSDLVMQRYANPLLHREYVTSKIFSVSAPQMFIMYICLYLELYFESL